MLSLYKYFVSVVNGSGSVCDRLLKGEYLCIYCRTSMVKLKVDILGGGVLSKARKLAVLCFRVN